MRRLVDSAEEVVEVVRDGIVVEFKCGVAIEQEYVK